MSLDFTDGYTYDYSDHSLVDNKNKYEQLYKLYSANPEEIQLGEKVLVKTKAGQYGLFIAVADTSDDGTLHLTKYSDLQFIKDECL